MPDSYVVLWNQERCRKVRQLGEVGTPLEVLYGGSHISAPNFSTFGVTPGDFIYPVTVQDGIMYVVARLRVLGILPLRQFLAEVLELPEARMRWWDPAWQKELWENRADLGHRLPYGCLNEAAFGPGEIPIRFDRAVPGAVLDALTFLTRKGEERRPKYVEQGRMLRTVTLQGKVYRLNDASRAAFEEIVDPVEPRT